MIKKEIEFNPMDGLTRGVNKLANAVKSTLGPSGKNVIIEQENGNSIITKDGVTVAKSINLEDPIENIGAQIVKEVSSKTADIAGDGTTTASVLAQSILNHGYGNSYGNEISVKNALDDVLDLVLNRLDEQSRDIANRDELIQIATISANGDNEIGNAIANAIEQVGKDGVVTIDESKTTETELEFVEGMMYDRGYISPMFVSNSSTLNVEFENGYILLIDGKVSSIQDLLPLLEYVQRENRSLLIVAEDIQGEVLATLIVNKLRGMLNVAATKAPGYGNTRSEILEDIATLTGATVLSEARGMKLSDLTPDHLGTAQKLIVSKDSTTIIDGSGEQEKIANRIESIKAQIDSETSSYTKEKLQERLAKLSGGVAILKLGAYTEFEMGEKKARAEDALHATKAAVQYGILPGGGIALFREALRLNADDTTVSREMAIARDNLILALQAPLMQILTNAGLNESEIDTILNTIENEEYSYGYDAREHVYGDMFTMGIIDPTKVTKSALENAVSVAGLMLTTDAVVYNLPTEEKSSDMGDMGGYYG